MTIFNWIWENVWSLLAIYIVIRHGKMIYRDLIFTPLAGGNGKVQMDELAKAVILGAFIFSMLVDAFRKTTEHVFSDNYYFGLLLSVCAIAAIKPAFSSIKNYFREPEKPAQ